MTNDQINGSFELVSGFMATINIIKLWEHKKLKGVSVIPAIFYVIWGFFNLFFYSSLNLPLSYYCGIFITSTNLCWVILYFYFKYKEKDVKYRY